MRVVVVVIESLRDTSLFPANWEPFAAENAITKRATRAIERFAAQPPPGAAKIFRSPRPSKGPMPVAFGRVARCTIMLHRKINSAIVILVRYARDP